MADDIDFKQAMQDVRPLKKNTAAAATNRRPENRALRAQIQARAQYSAEQLEASGAQQVEQICGGQSNEDGDKTLFYLSSGLQKKVLRELKKGTRYKVEHCLDLHGYTRVQAQREIDKALQNLDPSRLQCLLFIHGKGLHSTSGAQLKTFTATYLKMRPEVKAYCSAQPQDGGNGAVYVLVRG